MPRFLLALCLSLAATAYAQAPAATTCCDAAPLSTLLEQALRIHGALAGDASLAPRLNSYVFGAVGTAESAAKQKSLPQAERDALNAFAKTMGAVKNSKAPAIAAAFAAASLDLALIARRHEGGSHAVAEVICGEQLWLQDPTQPLSSPYAALAGPACTPALVR